MTEVCIYTITSPTNRIYVGQTWHRQIRESYYRRLEITKKSGQPKVYRSIVKYGWGSHSFKIRIKLSSNTTQSVLDFWEKLLMDIYRYKGYKLLNSKEGGSNGKHSDESRIKMSVSQKKRYLNGTKPWNFGKPISEEQKQKLREINLGKKYGPQSKEDREKKRQAHLGRKRTGTALENIRKFHPVRPIDQFTKNGQFIRSWPSVKEAQKSLKLHNISKNVHGEIKTCGGFVWKKSVQYDNNDNIRH